MLYYFVSHAGEIDEVQLFCNSINTLKHLIKEEKYEAAFKVDHGCISALDNTIEYARSVEDEKLANSCFVAKRYYLMFLKLAEYFNLLENGQYKDSWNALQDCLDELRSFAKHCGNDLYEAADIQGILENYESLYPYTHYLSPGFIIGKATCSICGASMLGANCSHICGNIYWGQQAYMIIEEIMMREISIVENPDNKRKILEINGKEYTFERLEQYLSLGIPFLKRININETKKCDDNGNVLHIDYHITPINEELKWYYFNCES